MELLGNTQNLRQQAAALGMNPKDSLICFLKASISAGTYSTDIFRFATLVFQETAKVTASKNMFISVSGMVQNGCG